MEPSLEEGYHGPPIGTLFWMSPELIARGGYPHTTSSDVWAFGMMIYEVSAIHKAVDLIVYLLRVQILSGRYPYEEFDDVISSMQAIVVDGVLPNQSPRLGPDGTSYEVPWHVAFMCWKAEPSERPTMEQVFRQLRVRDSIVARPPAVEATPNSHEGLPHGIEHVDNSDGVPTPSLPTFLEDPWTGLDVYTATIDVASLSCISWTNYSKTYKARLLQSDRRETVSRPHPDTVVPYASIPNHKTRSL